jgi:CheY-like chemotaxis protein
LRQRTIRHPHDEAGSCAECTLQQPERVLPACMQPRRRPNIPARSVTGAARRHRIINQPTGPTVPSQIQDLLLPMLFAGAVGVLIGWALSALRAARRRQVAATTAQPHPSSPRRLHAGPRGAARRLPEPTPRDIPSRPLPSPALPRAADLLLVDDSAVARAKLRRLFETAGYHVHLACDGVEALALLEKGRYAMMITDLEMPNMDGVTLINTCLGRPQTARMPIMAISGHESLRAKFNECRDICGIHRKPWADDILLSHVAALVSTRREPQATPAA